MKKYNTLEFKKRQDGMIYYFHPSECINEHFAWKRGDIDIFITYQNGFGWCVIDSNKNILGIPWGVLSNETQKLPPLGKWVSCKDDKAYVYDLSI